MIKETSSYKLEDKNSPKTGRRMDYIRIVRDPRRDVNNLF